MTLLFSIPPLLSLLGFFGMGGVVFFKGPRNKTNGLFVCICALSGLLYLDIVHAFNAGSAQNALWVSRIDHLFIAFLVPLYLQFFHAYLGIKAPRFLIPAAYGLATCLMCLAPMDAYIAAMEKHVFGYFAKAGPLYALFGGSGVGATCYVSVLVYRAGRREPDSHRRKQLWYVFAGFGGLGILNGLNFFTIHGASVYPPGNFAFIPMAAFAYGLYRHNLLNMAIIINIGMVYTLTTACLTCLYALIITVATLIPGFDHTTSHGIPVILFLLVALVFGPLKTRVQKTIDRQFFKQRYNYQQTLKNVSRMIVSVLDIDTIGQTLIRTVQETMGMDHCRLLLTTAGGSDLIRYCGDPGQHRDPGVETDTSPLFWRLQQERRPMVKNRLAQQAHFVENAAVVTNMDEENLSVAIPLVFKDHINGYLLLGRKRSGDPYSQEDIDLLETLSGQSALAIENARSYQRVDELNNRLEEKVVKRTRALERALAEKERTQEELVRSESLAAIGQLVAGVAHELNNPLASTVSLVQTTIEDLEDWAPGTPLDEEIIDDLKFADKELRRAREIVKSLLGLSRQTDTYCETVPLNAVVRDALRVLHNQYKHQGVMIIERYGSDLPDIQGNFAGLGQVVINVIQNAFQAVGANGGTIEIFTGYEPAVSQVVFKCTDSGPGIPASVRKDIFKPFFTTKEPGKGTGLGLYISHEIVQKHGGILSFMETDGGGAGFCMSLPVSMENAHGAIRHDNDCSNLGLSSA